MQPPRRPHNNQGNNQGNNQNRGGMPRHNNNKNRHNNNRNNGQNRGGQNAGGRINISQVTNQRDKYLNMARDAQHSGDRVVTEYYLQYADHYQRLINEYNEEQESRRAQFAQQPEDQAPEDAGNTEAMPSDAEPTTDSNEATEANAAAPRARTDRRPRTPRPERQPRRETAEESDNGPAIAAILPPPIFTSADSTDEAAAADGE